MEDLNAIDKLKGRGMIIEVYAPQNHCHVMHITSLTKFDEALFMSIKEKDGDSLLLGYIYFFFFLIVYTYTF